MANMTFGVNILPQDNTVALGQSGNSWRIVSPSLEGTPTAPTVSNTFSDTKIATTAFVHNSIDAYINKPYTPIEFTLDNVTNTSGSYSHKTTDANVVATMKPVSIELGNPEAFLDSVTIITENGGITLSCSDVRGTSTAKVMVIDVANTNNTPYVTSNEYNTLSTTIGTLSNLLTSSKTSVVNAINTLVNEKANKANTVLTNSLSCGRKSETTVGMGSIAFGSYVEASNFYSCAIGYNNTASGYMSHAEGDSSTASGQGAHSEGSHNSATGNYSHAEGAQTTASGQGSHAEGQYNSANGNYSHVEGQGTNAMIAYSHAGGKYNIFYPLWDSTVTYDLGDMVTYNNHVYNCVGHDITDIPGSSEYWELSDEANFAEIIGNGTSTSSRSNARALDWNGNEYLKGTLYVGCDANSIEGGVPVATQTDIAAISDIVISKTLTIPTSGWSNSAPYTYTWLDSDVTASCHIKVEFSTGAQNNNLLYLEYEKVTGGVQFTAPNVPNAGVAVVVHIFKAQAGSFNTELGANVTTSAISGAANVDEALAVLDNRLSSYTQITASKTPSDFKQGFNAVSWFYEITLDGVTPANSVRGYLIRTDDVMYGTLTNSAGTAVYFVGYNNGWHVYDLNDKLTTTTKIYDNSVTTSYLASCKVLISENTVTITGRTDGTSITSGSTVLSGLGAYKPNYYFEVPACVYSSGLLINGTFWANHEGSVQYYGETIPANTVVYFSMTYILGG